MPKAAKNIPKETPEEKKKIDDAFQTLLASQRDILSQLKFGNSASELDYSPEEDPDTEIPMVSPHTSSEFDTGSEYQNYHDNLKRSSVHSFGVGDDQFILDHITIEPGQVQGPEEVDFDSSVPEAGQKRNVERTDRSVKKRRRMSSAQFCADLLPGPSDLDDLDDASSTSSLLLDDLDMDIPSMHDDAQRWDPRDPSMFADDSEDELELDAIADLCSSGEKPEELKTGDISITKEKGPTRSAPLKRSVTKESSEFPDLKPAAESDDVDDDDDDMDCSIQIEDLEFPNGRRCVSRSNSSQSQQRTLSISSSSSSAMDDSSNSTSSRRSDATDAPTVEQLSMCLQKSNDSMKLIQDWDRKMGLKRSHSKTMQLTRRSREQLLAAREQLLEFLKNQDAKNAEDSKDTAAAEETSKEVNNQDASETATTKPAAIST